MDQLLSCHRGIIGEIDVMTLVFGIIDIVLRNGLVIKEDVIILIFQEDDIRFGRWDERIPIIILIPFATKPRDYIRYDTKGEIGVASFTFIFRRLSDKGHVEGIVVACFKGV